MLHIIIIDAGCSMLDILMLDSRHKWSPFWRLFSLIYVVEIHPFCLMIIPRVGLHLNTGAEEKNYQ